MGWVLIGLAVASFTLAIVAGSTLVAALAFFASFGLLCLGVLALLSSRVSRSSRSEIELLGPEELRRMREAAARRDAAAAGGAAKTRDARPEASAGDGGGD